MKYTGSNAFARRAALWLGILMICLSTATEVRASQFVVTPDPVNIAEGTNGTITVTLNANPGPGQSVQYSVSKDSGDPDLNLTGITSGTLTDTNWNIGNTHTIEALTDGDNLNGSATFAVVTVTATFTNPNTKFFTANESEAAPATTTTTTTDEQDTPEAKIGNAVNLNTTRRISSVVSNKIFIQRVMPIARLRPTTPPAPTPAPTGPGPASGPTSSADPQRALDDFVLAQQPAPVGGLESTWSMGLSSSARYARTKYHDYNDSTSDRAGVTLNSSHVWDRWSVDVSVPLDIVHFDDELTEYDYWRLGAVVMPRYRLLDEDINGIELTVGASAYYMRTDMVTEEFYNPDHTGLGFFVGTRKTLGDIITVSGGIMAQRAWNLDGEDEITDDRNVDVITAGINIGAPIGDNWAVNAMLTYDHIPELPGWMDEDVGMAGLSATYFLGDTWTLDGTVLTDVFNSDERDIQFHVGLGWQF